MKIAGTRFNCVEVKGKKLITDVAKGQNPIAVSRACHVSNRVKSG